MLYTCFYKTKRTYLPYIHFFLPITFATIGILYQMFSLLDEEMILSAYLTLIGTAFPLITGVVSSKVCEIEEEAGHFQALLSHGISRKISYFGILCSLLIAGSFSVSLITIPFFLSISIKDMAFYLWAILLLMAGAVFLYIFHLFLSFSFGSGVSIGIGVFETLLALLGLTGLGDGIWYYLPALWSGRLMSLLVFTKYHPDFSIFSLEITKWLPFFGVYTVIGLVLSLIWFERWEGRKNFE